MPESLNRNHYVYRHDFIKPIIRLYSFNLFHWNTLSHDMNATRYRQSVRWYTMKMLLFLCTVRPKKEYEQLKQYSVWK